MKTTPILFTLMSVATLATASAQSAIEYPKTAEEVGVLPAQKSAAAAGSKVESGSRNPFASRTKGSSSGPVAQETMTEETRIRAVLERFTINGVAKTNNGGYSAQAGPLILREGERVPHLIDDQTDELRVTKVTPRLVEITWVGDEDAEQPRQVTLPIDMVATVAVVLPSPDKGEGPRAIIGAERILEEPK